VVNEHQADPVMSGECLSGGVVLTWKVWTDDSEPVFEGTKEQARAYVTGLVPDRPEAVLESPDGESFGYQDGVWVCLDRLWGQ
jgi:hypothetical protein